MRLCDLALDSGADAVKFQVYSGDTLVSSVSSPERNAHFKTFELTREQHVGLAERVRAAGRQYMASVWDEAMLEWIGPLVEIHKVGSGDLTCYPILRALAATGKPIVLSTGLATFEDIRGAVEWIARQDESYATGGKLALLQSTAAYPAPDESANLRVIPALATEFGLPIGYSDHTVGADALELAYALGARILEKHFTDSRDGKAFRDHQISLTADEVRALLGRLRRAEALLGSPAKGLTEAERAAGHEVSFRRALHARRYIAAGEALTADNVAPLRPEVGIGAARYYEVLGRKTARAIEPLAPIREDDLAP